MKPLKKFKNFTTDKNYLNFVKREFLAVVNPMMTSKDIIRINPAVDPNSGIIVLWYSSAIALKLKPGVAPPPIK